MGLLTRLLSFSRRSEYSVGVVDSGGQNNFTAEHFSDPGDDSQPLPDDYVVTVGVQRSGGQVAAGYVDLKNLQTAGPGEKRIYARDSTGAAINQVWLQSSGDIRINNGSGLIVMSANGTVNINGVTISAAGVVTVPDSLRVAGDEVAQHIHPAGDLLDSGGRPCSGNSGPI